MVKCEKCDKLNPKNAKFCESCGEKLKKDFSKNLLECKDCGNKVSKSAKFCPKCGAEFEGPDEDITRGITKRKSPGDAAVLSVLFGPFGYLYTRRYGLCVLWLFLGLFLIAIIGLWAGPVLWIAWAVHNYNIAKKINEELEKR